MKLSWSVAGRALPGQQESGDLAVVEIHEAHALLAVIDGLGHGREAAAAARVAAATLRAAAPEGPEALLQRCHQQLRLTRGAVMSVVTVDHDRVRWCGVGNVEALIVATPQHPRHSLVLRGGVVGGNLPTLRPSYCQLGDGDLLLMVTDGIASRFAESLPPNESTEEIARLILSRHARPTDDALVLAVRFRQ